VTHYFSHLSVATLRLDSGTLQVGDVIHVRGRTTDFKQRIESLEVHHAPVSEVGPNDDFELKVVEHARSAEEPESSVVGSAADGDIASCEAWRRRNAKGR
jgi:translation elongation factor EF-1alpha